MIERLERRRIPRREEPDERQRRRFAPGELIRHSSFGLGVVVAERDSVKIDVHFPDGPKVLLHGR